jgi:hypothetical protein
MCAANHRDYMYLSLIAFHVFCCIFPLKIPRKKMFSLAGVVVWLIRPYFVSLDNPPISGINSILQIKFWRKGGWKEKEGVLLDIGEEVVVDTNWGVQCYFVPDRCVPEQKARMMRPLDEASLRRRVSDRWVLKHFFVFYFFIFSVIYSTLLHLPPFRFHCVGGCWDLTQDSCDLGLAVRHFNHSARSHPQGQNKSIRDTMYMGRIFQGTLCPRDASSQGHIFHGTQHPTDFVFGTYRSGTLYHVIVL